jgi:hypothetical protein
MHRDAVMCNRCLAHAVCTVCGIAWHGASCARCWLGCQTALMCSSIVASRFCYFCSAGALHACSLQCSCRTTQCCSSHPPKLTSSVLPLHCRFCYMYCAGAGYPAVRSAAAELHNAAVDILKQLTSSVLPLHCCFCYVRCAGAGSPALRSVAA